MKPKPGTNLNRNGNQYFNMGAKKWMGNGPVPEQPVAPAEPVSEPMPCPWCGSRPIIEQRQNGVGIKCAGPLGGWCPIMPDLTSNTREEAIALWNQRAK